MAVSIADFKFNLTLSAALQLAIGDKSAKIDVGKVHKLATPITSGTTANKADRWWEDNDGRTLAASGTETIDLYDFGSIDIGGGAGKDPLGQALALVEIVGLLVIVDAASTGTLLIGGDGTAAAWNSIFNGDDEAAIGPLAGGSICFLFNPANPAFPVADSSNHLLKFTEAGGANSVIYYPFILGRSA